MKTFHKNSIVIALAVSFVLSFVGPATAALAGGVPIDLGAASSFAVLAGTPFIANTGSSVITGNVGLSPATGAGITGFPPATLASGTIYAVDAAGPAGSVSNAGLLTLAKNALTAAYLNAAGQTPASTVGSELGGTTLSPGIYTSADTTFHITGNLTLDAHGDPNAVFIFQVGSTLTTAASSSVSLINSAQACNVYWQIGSSAATLGTNSIFKGNILGLTSITLTTGANVEGRILARNGAVTLDSNVITVPTCTTPAPATLHVIKLVAGGTAAASSFAISVKNSSGTEVSGGPFAGVAAPGTLYSVAAGTYTVSESANASYASSFDAFCPGGTVTLAPGSDVTCTVTNTYVPVLASALPLSSGSGRIVPLIGLTKVPSPLALPGGPGSTTYNYTVWNVGGKQALDDITVADDTCGPVAYVSGDVNGNGKIDPGEQWKYSCTATLAKTTTNTAIATGYSDDAFHQATIATAVATVVVGAPITPPLINVVKVPSRLTPFSYGGGNVTYAYTVTNPGVVPLHNVIVGDNKCAPVSYVSGDANGNNLLEPSEAWTYTCNANVSVSTMNTATAQGSANGFTALGYAFATVLVAAPGLPNTGFPPAGAATTWALVGLAAIMVIGFASFFVLKKRRA